MIFNLIFTLLGLCILVFGGEVILRGAVKLALHFKLSPAVVGLTVVAAGTSVPELAVSLLAAWNGNMDVAVGNVVGSNIFNIAFILGTIAIYRPLKVTGNSIKLEYPFLMIVTFLFFILVRDQLIGRLDGILFLSIYVAFTAYLIRVVRKEITPVEKKEFEREVSEIDSQTKGDLLPGLLMTIAGVFLLTCGAELTVTGAVEIGKALGMSERIIGLTIISIGTGLPEVVTSVVASYKGQNDIAIANVIGSNIFNILCILGITSLVAPLPVAAEIMYRDCWWLLLITALLFPIMRSGFEIKRKEGQLLAIVYGVYLLQLIIF